VASGNIYVMDVSKNASKPKLYKEIKGEDLLKATDGAFPHSIHCLPNGDIMISFIGTHNL